MHSDKPTNAGDVVRAVAFNVAKWVYKRVLISTLHPGADNSLARPGRKQATGTEDFDVHIQGGTGGMDQTSGGCSLC